MRPPFPRRAIFEALEPRVLLSASPTLVGTPFDDNDISGNPAIYGTLGDDVIDALGGDDYVYGDGIVSGAGGNDIIVGGDGRDLLLGEDGDDWLEPGPMPQPVLANQTVDGGDGLDTLFLLGAPTSYQFYEYTDGGFIADAAYYSGAPEGQVAAYDIERVAFGVSALDYADGTARPLALVDVSQLVGWGADRAAIAVADTIVGARGASEILIALPQILGNDIDLDGDLFDIAELLGAPGVTVAGFDASPTSVLPDVPPEYAFDFPDGLVRVQLDAPLTAPLTFGYRLADASSGLVLGNVATVTLQPSPPPTAADDTLRATLGQDNYFDVAALLANDSPGLTFRGIVPGSVTLGDNVAVEDYGSSVRVASFGTTPTSLSFAYDAEDAFGNVAVANVTVEVFNHAPVVGDGAAVVSPGGTYALRFADLAAFPGTFDPNGDALAMAFYALAVPPTVTLMGFEDRIEFAFAADYAGDYVLDFALADATGAQDAGRFRFLTTLPAAPVAVADTLRWGMSTSAGEAFGTFSLSRLLANDVLAPGMKVYADYASFAQPAHGILYVEPGNPTSVVPTTDPLNLMLSYMPQAGFTGIDTVTYAIVDEFGRRSTTILTFDVSVPRPVVPDTTITLPPGATSVTFSASTLLANATLTGTGKLSGYAIRFDADSGVLQATADSVSGNYTSFTYTPDANTVLGQDAFFVGVIDQAAEGGSARGSTFVRFVPEGGATVSIQDATVQDLEGTAAGTGAILSVLFHRAGDLSGPVTLTYVLEADTRPGASSANANDLDDGFGTRTVTIPAGWNEWTVDFRATADRIHEADETFVVRLVSAEGGTIGAGSSRIITIANDDPPTSDISLDSRILVGGVEVGVDEFGSPAGSTYTLRLTAENAAGADLAADARVWIFFPDAAIDVRGMLPEDADVVVEYFPGDSHRSLWWQVGPLGAGEAASLDLQLASLLPTEVQLLAEVWESTAPDFDSTPGNGVGAHEDDALVVVLYATPGATPVVRPDSYTVVEGGTLTVLPSQGLLVNDDVLRGSAITVSGSHPGVTLTMQPDGGFTFVAPSGITGDASYSYSYTVTDVFGQTSAPAQFTIVVQDVIPPPVVEIVAATEQELEGTAAGTGAILSVLFHRVGDLNGPTTLTYVLEADTRAGASSASASDLDDGFGTRTVTIPAGWNEWTVDFLATADRIHEADETFVVRLVSAEGGTIGAGSSRIITIANDDPATSDISLDSRILVGGAEVGVDEFGSPAGSTYTLRLTAANAAGADLAADARVWIFFPDSAIDVRGLLPEDADVVVEYFSGDSHRSLWWQVGPLGAGESASLDLQLASLLPTEVQLLAEVWESTAADFDSTPGNGVGAHEDDALAVVLYATPGAPPVARPDSYTVVEGGTLTIPPSQGLLVNDDVLRGSAIAVSGSHPGVTLTMQPDGGFTFVAPSGITGDASYSYSYTVTDAFGQASAPAQFTIVVQDVIPPPVVEIVAATERELEGTATGTGAIVYAVFHRTGDLGGPTTLTYVLEADTRPGASSASANDLDDGFGTRTVTIPAGWNEWTVDFRATADRIHEADETFVVRLVSAEGGTIGAGSSRIITIANDDQATSDLSLSLDIVADRLEVGASADVIVRVDNAGPDSAGGTVQLTSGAGVSFLGTSEGFDPASGLWTFGPIAAGGFAEIAIETLFAIAGTPDIVGEIVTSSAPDPDSAPGNGTTNAEDDVAADGVAVRAVAPIAQDSTRNDFEDAPGILFSLASLSTVAQGDTATWSVTSVFGGTLAGFDPQSGLGSFVYAPDFNGAARIDWTVTNATGLTDGATITIDVAPVNDAPRDPQGTDAAQAFSTVEDTPIVIAFAALVGDDINPADEVQFAALAGVFGAVDGAATINGDSTITFTPDANFHGTAGFYYTAVDEQGAVGNPVWVPITVTAVNDAPVAVEDGYSVRAGDTLTVSVPGILANDTDVDGDPLHVNSFDATGLRGTLVPIGQGGFAFTPTAGFVGTTSFNYFVEDDGGGFDRGTVTIAVLANRSPVAVDDAYAVRAGDTLTVSVPGILANDTDADGDPLRVNSFDATGLRGTLVPIGQGGFAFTPTAGFVGTTSFDYFVEDDRRGFDRGTVTMVVIGNRAPVALDDAYSVLPGGTLTVTAPGMLANDTDVDGDPLRVNSFDATGLRGSLGATSQGGFTFTPVAGFVGTTSFGYAVEDDRGGFDLGTVTIRVGTADPVAVVTGWSTTDAGATPEGNGPGPAGTLTFVITRNGDLSFASTVNFSVEGGAGGTTSADVASVAAGGTDLGAGFGTYSAIFAAGQASATITVRATGDLVPAADKGVVLTLLSTSEGALVQPDARVAAGRFLNDDPVPADLSLTARLIAADGFDAGDEVAVDGSDPFTVELTVSNAAGGAVASGVVASMRVPEGALAWQSLLPEEALVTLEPDGGTGFDLFSWDVGQIAAGSTATVELRFLATALGEFVLNPQISASGSPDPDSAPGNAATTAEDDEAVLRVLVSNRPPVAVADTVTIGTGVPTLLDVRANDGDADGDPITISGVSPGTGLEVAIEGGQVRVTARAGEGSYAFDYTIRDPFGVESTASVTVMVVPMTDLRLSELAATTTLPNHLQLGEAAVIEFFLEAQNTLSAQDVVVAVEIPAGLQLEAWSTHEWFYSLQSMSTMRSASSSVTFDATTGIWTSPQVGTSFLHRGTSLMLTLRAVGPASGAVRAQVLSASPVLDVDSVPGNGYGQAEDDSVVHAVEIPSIRVTGTDVVEGAGPLTFTAVLAAPLAQAASYQVRTENLGAVAGQDYTQTIQMLTFAPGETTKSILVPVLDDTLAEAPEGVRLVIESNTGGTPLRLLSTDAWIIDDENQRPVGGIDSYTTFVDVGIVVGTAPEPTTTGPQPPAGVLLNDLDPEGGVLTAQLVSGPSHGELLQSAWDVAPPPFGSPEYSAYIAYLLASIGSGPQPPRLGAYGDFVYRPFAGYTGADSFVYRAVDALGATSDPVTVSIVVVPAAVNVRQGTAGDDTLVGTPGRDRLSGGEGNDQISGLAGDDELIGDEGTFPFSTGGQDILNGGGGNDRLYGGNDTDLLFGEDGDDVLEGGAGDDALSGGPGNDVLSGGLGSDVMDGGPGIDILDGNTEPGSGPDTFVIRAGEGTDIIRHFAAGEDTLRVIGVDGTVADWTFAAHPENAEVVVLRDGNGVVFGYFDSPLHGPMDQALDVIGRFFAVAEAQGRIVVGNTGPALEPIGDAAVNELGMLTVDVEAQDADGDRLTFSLVQAPEGASIDRASGVLRWTAPAVRPTDAVRFVVQVSDGTVEVEEAFHVQVRDLPLRVASLAATASGFDVRFNRPLDVGVFNVYESTPENLGPADLVLRGSSGASIRGSAVIDPDGQGLRFVKTGGALVADTYTLSIRGAPDGLVDLAGRALDGDDDGLSGGEYVATFTVHPSTDRVLSIADFARGPGQDVVVPNRAQGGLSLPVQLSEGLNVRSMSFDLRFDAALLDILAVEIVEGRQGTVTRSPIEGGERIEVRFDETLSAGPVKPLNLVVRIPSSATYGAAGIISLDGVQLLDALGNPLAATGDAAVHVAAYFMDTSGNATYSMLDVQRLQRVAARLDTGFGAYPNVDPVLIGDLNGSGQINSLDVTRLLQYVQGTSRPEIPELPTGTSPLVFTGPARNIGLAGSTSAAAGERVAVTLTMDDASGVESVTAKIVYDDTRLDYVGVRLLADFPYKLVKETSGEIVIDLARASAFGVGVEDLLAIDFDVRSDAAGGPVLVDLQRLHINEGRLNASVPSQPGTDPTDAQITVVAEVPASPESEALVGGESTGTTSLLRKILTVLSDLQVSAIGAVTDRPSPSSIAQESVDAPVLPDVPPPSVIKATDDANPAVIRIDWTPPAAVAASDATEDWKKAPWVKTLNQSLIQRGTPTPSSGGADGKPSTFKSLLTAPLRR